MSPRPPTRALRQIGELPERKPSVPEPPEPLEWRPRPTFRARLLGAVGTPVMVGTVIFIAAVAVAVLLVMMRPHAPGGVGDGETGSQGAGEDIIGDSSANPGAAPGASLLGDPPAEDAAEVLFVHVVGEVLEPGVVSLAPGARVRDAIDAAGGATELAVLAGVNLARVVTDGEQIVVPDAESVDAVAPVASSGAGLGPDAAGTVNINTADASALDTLPRVGPALASRIIDWREANGGFQSVEQLLEVEGIGLKTLEELRERVRV